MAKNTKAVAELDWSILTPRICPAGECFCGGWCWGADESTKQNEKRKEVK